MNEEKAPQNTNEEGVNNDHSAQWPIGQLVAITVSPNSRLQGAMANIAKRKPTMMISYESEKERFTQDWNEIFQSIEGWKDDWKMYLEIGKGGFFHWHGYATIKDPPRFAREFGFYIRYAMHNQICIKPINSDDNLNKWKTYCKKDHKSMGTILTKVKTTEGIMKYIQKK